MGDVLGTLARGGNIVADAPLFWYSYRQRAVVYLVLGLFLTVIAGEPQRHLSLVKAAIFGLGLIAVVSAAMGPLTAMPLLWYGADTLFSLVFFVLLCRLYPSELDKQA